VATKKTPKASVLVVDDDRVTRLLVKTTLVKAGFAVRVANDGAAAVKAVRAKRFDLMVLDVWMPRLDGFGVLERLKKVKRAPKVIVMTSDDTPETMLRAIREQASQHIHKPVDPAELVSIVRDTLKVGAEPPIQVVSARPNWVELVVPCTRAAAQRIHDVMSKLEGDLPEDVREAVSYAFRELLLNAVEWGGRFDPKRTVRISYLRATRMLLYRIADPGPGFKMDGLVHAAISHPGAPIEHVQIREDKGLRPGGFGLVMVRAHVDELIYNEKQNEVVFVKYLDKAVT